MRTLPLAELLLDALPVQAASDARHPLRFLAGLSPRDIAVAVRGCAQGLERLLQVRRGDPCKACSARLSRDSFVPCPVEIVFSGFSSRMGSIYRAGEALSRSFPPPSSQPKPRSFSIP